MLKEALKYLSLGLSVIPVSPRGKEPLLPWKEFQQRRASEAEVREWFIRWPDANLGIVSGRVSGVVVVDLDGPEGQTSAKNLQMQSSAVSFSGKGKHLWYKHPGSTVENAVRKYPGLDIRGDGGYVLVAPSIHPNGSRYRWISPVTSVEQLPVFPLAVFAKTAPQIGQDVRNVGDGSVLSRNAPGWIAKDLEAMTNGNIDDTLFRICCRLRHDGYGMDDAFIFLEHRAEKAGATPGHLQDKINNVWGRYESKRRDTTTLQSHGTLVLHSPTNPDSIQRYAECQLGDNASAQRYETGYPKFDAITKGLKKGEVLTVAARTGVGKTNWIITPIRSFCMANKKVLLFSTEMSFDQIWSRYRATLGRSESFDTHQFYICDEFTPDIARIEEAIRHVQPDLFIFDHISHIGTDYHIISKFMSEIKRLTRLFNIPGIVTAQLNRNADWVQQGERVTPRMSMIQGSGAIEQISGAVLLLSEKRINGNYTEIEGVIDKNRHGDKGMVQFALKRNPYRVEEI
jgi:KaiC/GvpD/RAD55 family RecA-like ATPase